MRLAVALVLSAVGSVGMWSFVVALPAVQADFGIARGEASLAFTLTMFGFGIGGVVMGRLADRFGIVIPAILGAVAPQCRLRALGIAGGIGTFALAQGLLGLGSAATFGPLMTDMSHWFVRRRGIAVAIVSSGNYLGGTIWPPIVQHFIETDGWRTTQMWVGVFCIVTLIPLSLLLRRRAPAQHSAVSSANAAGKLGTLGISANAMMVLLSSPASPAASRWRLPQVHIVAYCGDLGYGPARGAEMLSMMLGFRANQPHRQRLHRRSYRRRGDAFAQLCAAGRRAASVHVLRRFIFSLCDFGAVRLFQGGIVPMYAIIVREYFAPQEAGTRLGLVLLATSGEWRLAAGCPA